MGIIFINRVFLYLELFVYFLFVSLFCCMLLCAHFQDKSVLSSQEMNTLEVSDPKVCIIIDFRENGAFASQDLPFPSTALRLTPKEWLASQLNRHRKAFEWIKESQNAIEGLLLMNVERHSKIFLFRTNCVCELEYLHISKLRHTRRKS